MPIRPFLAGLAFEPETITKMSAGFESVCEVLEPKVESTTLARGLLQKDNRARPTGGGRGHVGFCRHPRASKAEHCPK